MLLCFPKIVNSLSNYPINERKTGELEIQWPWTTVNAEIQIYENTVICIEIGNY